MKLSDVLVINFFSKGNCIADSYLEQYNYPWEILPDIDKIILSVSKTLGEDYLALGGNRWAHKTAKIAPTAFIGDNVIVGENTEIRHSAFIRGNALIGDNAVVGNSTELKNVILFNGAQAPHFNYVGDSIMGYKSHLGAGAITSNVKGNSGLVSVAFDEAKIETGLKKFGAILGDNVEIGCNAVLNPGSVIGRNAQVYPLSMVRGTVDGNSIYKKLGEVVGKF